MNEPELEDDDFDDDDTEDTDFTTPDARPVQPAGSKITIERFPDGLTITVPPTGIWSQGLFVFGLIWNGFLGRHHRHHAQCVPQ